MPKRSDFYKTLGVAESATQDEIKRAYRVQAKKFHPDRNPDNPTAEERFKEVQEAYSVVGDAKKRAEYDQFGEVGVGQWATDPGGNRSYQWGGSAVDMEDLEDLFSAFGGGGRRASIFDQFTGGGRGRTAHSPPKRGTDQEQRINLTFEQALFGTSVTLSLRSASSGHTESLDVKIPPGVQDGQKIRLKGKGQPGARGGPAGDLLLVCSVAGHPFFTRRGADIYLDVPVTISEAALGAKIDIPTLDGRATVTLPPGTTSGSKLRLRGRGAKKRNTDERGDQYAVVTIVPPKELTDEQRACLESLRELDAPLARQECGWWKGPTS